LSILFNDLENQMKQIKSIKDSAVATSDRGTFVVSNIDARNAINAVEGNKAFVMDASDDATVVSGSAEYIYNGSAWVKIGEAESMDLGYDAGLKKFEATAPLLGAADAVLASTGLGAADVVEVTEGLSNPDVPRILSVTGNAASVAGDVVIEGTNVNDDIITETITSSGTSTVEGTKAFKTVTSITLPVVVDPADEISVGTGDKLGIGKIVSIGLPVYSMVGDVKETTDPTISSDSAVEANLIEFNSALDGSSDVVCYFID
jgi:hypothetical protein